MAKENLSEAFVESIKDVPKLTEYWDKKLAGFFLRVTPNGTKTFAASYRHNGRPRKITIGEYGDLFSVKKAREAAAGYLRDAKAGADPQAEKKANREATTFGDLTAEYIKGHATVHKRASSAYADKCMIESDLDAWKNLKAADITNGDVTALLGRIVRRGSPIKANRTLALISKIFRFAIGTGLLPRGTVSPTYLVPRPGKECSRERFLTDDEIKKLWAALASRPPHVAAFFKLLLLTGQRCREVLCMAKAEVDFEMGEWTVPVRPGNKSKRPNLLPLAPQAMALIESLKNAKADHPWIFPARSVKPAPITEYKTWALALRDELKFEPDWTAHDLRRTLETNLTKMGITRFIADKITNHKDSTVGGVYDRYEYKNEKRDALVKWDDKLAEIVAA